VLQLWWQRLSKKCQISRVDDVDEVSVWCMLFWAPKDQNEVICRSVGSARSQLLRTLEPISKICRRLRGRGRWLVPRSEIRQWLAPSWHCMINDRCALNIHVIPHQAYCLTRPRRLSFQEMHCRDCEYARQVALWKFGSVRRQIARHHDATRFPVDAGFSNAHFLPLPLAHLPPDLYNVHKANKFIDSLRSVLMLL